MGKKNRSRKKKSPPKDGAAAPGGGATAGGSVAAAAAAGDVAMMSGACCAPPCKDVAAAASVPATMHVPPAQASMHPTTPIQAAEGACQKSAAMTEHVTSLAGVRIEAAPMLCRSEVKQAQASKGVAERAASADSALSPPPAAAASGGKKKKRSRKKPQSDTESTAEPATFQKKCPRMKSQGEAQEVQVCPITKNLSTNFKEAEPMEVESAATCTCPHPMPLAPGGSKKKNKKKGKSPPKDAAGAVPMQGVIEQPQAGQVESPKPKPSVAHAPPPSAGKCEKPVASSPVKGGDVKKPSPPPSSRKRPRVKVDEVAIEIVATDVCSSKTLGLSWDDVAFNDLQEMCSQSDDKMEEETVSQVLKGVEVLESGSDQVKGAAVESKKPAALARAGKSVPIGVSSAPSDGQVMAVPPPVPHCPQVEGQQTVAVVETPKTKPPTNDDDSDDDCCMDFGDAFLSDIACEHTSTPSDQQPVDTQPTSEPVACQSPPAGAPSVLSRPQHLIPNGPVQTPPPDSLAPAPFNETQEDFPKMDSSSPKSEQVKFGSLSFADVVKRPRTISEAELENRLEEGRPVEVALENQTGMEIDVYDEAVERAVWCYLHDEGQRMQIYHQAELAESRYQEWLCSSTRAQPVEPLMQAPSQTTQTDVTPGQSIPLNGPAESAQSVTAKYLREEAERMEGLSSASSAEAMYFANRSQHMMCEKPQGRRSPVKLVCESSEKGKASEQMVAICMGQEAEKMNDLANARKAEARTYEQLAKQNAQPATTKQVCPHGNKGGNVARNRMNVPVIPPKPSVESDDDDDDFGGIDLGDAFLADVPCEKTSTPTVKNPQTPAKKPAEESDDDDDDDDFGGVDLGDAFLADVPCEKTTTPVVKEVQAPAKKPAEESDDDDDLGGIDLGDAFLADVPCEKTTTPVVKEVQTPAKTKPTEESDDDDDLGGIDLGDAFLADVPCEKTSTPAVNSVQSAADKKPVEESDDDDDNDFGGIDLGDAFLADVPCELTSTPVVKDVKPAAPSQRPAEESDDDDDFGGIDLGDAFLADVPCEHTSTIKQVVKAEVSQDVSSAPNTTAKRPLESDDDDDDDMAMDLGDAFLCDVPCELTSTPVIKKPAEDVAAKPDIKEEKKQVAGQKVLPMHRAPAPIEASSDEDDEMDLGDAFLGDVPCENTTTPITKETLKTETEESFDLEMEPFPVKEPSFFRDSKVGLSYSAPQSPGEYLLAKTIREEEEDVITKELKERKHLAELSNFLADSATKMELLKNAVNLECKYQEMMTSKRSASPKVGKKRDRKSSDRSTPESGHRMAIVEVEEVGIQTLPQKSPIILTPLRKSYKEALETPVVVSESVECQTVVQDVEPVAEGASAEELLAELAKEKASCLEYKESGLSLKNQLEHMQHEMSEMQLQKMTLEDEVIHLKELKLEEDKEAEEARLVRPAEMAVLVQLRQEQERCAEIEHAAMMTKEELARLRHHILMLQRKNSQLQRDFSKLQEQKIREEEEAKLTRPAEMAVLEQLRQEQKRCAKMERAAMITKEELVRLKSHVLELQRKNTLLQRECNKLQEEKVKEEEEARFMRPVEMAVLAQLRQEQERCAEIEHAAILSKQETGQLRHQVQEMHRRNQQLQRECSKLQSEVNLQSKFAEEYKQRNKVVESELTSSRQKILKLEDDLQKAIAFQSGMDLMLDAKMASDRAKDAETKAYALQTELTSAHIQIKQLTEKLVELTRDRGDMVSASVHQDALSRAEARAQEAEYQVMRLQNELLQIRGLAEVCLTPESPPPAAEGSGSDWPTLGESASRVTWAGVASRGLPPETTIDIADLPSTEIRGFQHDTLNVSSFDQSKSPGVTPELSTGEESDWSSSVDSDPVVGPPSLLIRKHVTEGSTSSDQAGAVGDPDPGELACEGATRMRPAVPPKPPGLGKIAGRSSASGKSEKREKPKVPPKPMIGRRPRPDKHESTTPTDVGGEVSSSFDEDLETPKLRLTRKPRGPTDRRKPSKFCKESKP